MAVVKRSYGDKSVVLVATDANRDLGVFLVFLGVVGTLPAQYFLDWLGYTAGPYAFVAAMIGLVLALVGLGLMGFSKKRFTVTSEAVVVSDGLFRRPVRYRWQEKPCIRLRGQEEEKGRRNVDFWLVNLIDGKRQYVLDRRAGHQIESRCLAEALAKSINCPVIERADHGDVTILRDDLDLPFAERVRRNPQLLGPEVPRPETCTASHWESESELGFSWRLAGSALFSEFVTVVFLLGLLALVPLFPERASPDEPDLPPERLQRSFFDLARQEQKYDYFILAGSFLVVGSVVLFGYQKELRATREALVARDRLWGIPISKSSIPAARLEEIWVRQTSRGTNLQFISDACIINGRTSSLDTANWLASKIRHFYAKG